jgi:4-hydroxy-3-methylbut-2-enyl diphosphate reductase
VEAAPEPAVEKEPEAVAEAKAEVKPDHEDSSDFAAAFEKTMTRIRNGQVIEGTVISIVDGEVFVNIGYKSDGVIPVNELSSDSDVKAEDLFKEGDTIEVEVTKVNDGDGNVLLSRKNVEGKKLWDELLSQEDIEDKIFDAVGKEVVKGGIIADISGIRAFVPASHVSIKYIENLSEFIGKPMKLKVLEVDRQRKRIVASQKQVLIAEVAAEKRAKWESLVVGSKVQGIVRRIADFGAFVDIGGIDGLVHVTDAAWGRVKHPSDVFTIGQEIEVLILNVDVEKERVSLGYKQLQPKPWMTAGEKYVVGSIVEGKVGRIVPFGAFVALESTIDGLIHISQVSVHRIAKVEDELKVGDIVRCKVLEVNPEAKRISLSRKEALLEEDPELAEQLKAEKAERDRQYAERQEQRQQQRDSQQAQQRDKRDSTMRAPAGERTAPEKSDRGDRRRRNEDGDYDLPPVQETTTSLASLFEGIKVEDK